MFKILRVAIGGTLFLDHVVFVFVRFRFGDFLAVVTQVLETSCKLLHRPPKKRKWALYNPSLLELSFPAFRDHGQGLTPCP